MLERKLKAKTRIKFSLTKKGRELLHKVQEEIVDNDNVLFALADFNGNIKIHLPHCYRETYVHQIKSVDGLDFLLREIDI